VGGGAQGGAGGGGVEGRLGKNKSSIDIFAVVDGMLFLSVQECTCEPDLTLYPHPRPSHTYIATQ
jgi:hypothetical protein